MSNNREIKASNQVSLDLYQSRTNNSNNQHLASNFDHHLDDLASNSQPSSSQQDMNRNNFNAQNDTSTSLNLNNLAQTENQTVLNLVNQSNLVNLINDAVNQQQQQQQQNQHQHQHLPQQQPNNNDQGDNQNGFVNLLVKTLQTSLPFFLILLVKILHQHLFGFFIVIGFITTLHYSNRMLVNQVQLKVIQFRHILTKMFFISKLKF